MVEQTLWEQKQLYLWEDGSDGVESSSFSSSLHCLDSSSEWTLITSLITCRTRTTWTVCVVNHSSVNTEELCTDSCLYLSVRLLSDVNVLGSVRLTTTFVVPHLCHQFQVSLWLLLFLSWVNTHTQKERETHTHTDLVTLAMKEMYLLTVPAPMSIEKIIDSS